MMISAYLCTGKRNKRVTIKKSKDYGNECNVQHNLPGHDAAGWHSFHSLVYTSRAYRAVKKESYHLRICAPRAIRLLGRSCFLSCPQKAASRWFQVTSLQSMIFVTKGYGQARQRESRPIKQACWRSLLQKFKVQGSRFNNGHQTVVCCSCCLSGFHLNILLY